ncbi:tRNA dihydrouridine synthase DusB [Pseudokineococcus lusitanus]|uniref:NifR3 family TIM-barrel protein n=1 Tax=Pseudokineococcus lusitanus TaxID=763993 RepID=A0A3N1HTD9_9ACTN|nr:tRNA dihydrouridine synthase DusB [Pseudokineococcus lusitanus]ROP45793.1 nifR3 family TIM-barrel protein [Pseudokineococcus lusitanus]
MSAAPDTLARPRGAADGPDAGAPATSPAPPPLRIGPHAVRTPVVLAPMAGITGEAYRRLCREQMESVGGEGVFVSEMVTSRALVERTPESMRLVTHGADVRLRSTQLYGVAPRTVGAAVRVLVEDGLADHVDLNFGCPVAKVTRKGGGAALPWKSSLFASVVREAVRAAEPAGIPVTVKMRVGIDAEHHTYLEAGRAAQGEGASAVALHARTAEQYYSGDADWSRIARLKEAVTEVPVLGNGDIWSGEDAVRMVAETGCDGVVVGRGCLGRPWLFADLAAAFAGDPRRVRPTLGEVAAMMHRHAVLLADQNAVEGVPDVDRACREIRKHVAWYLKGFPVGSDLRRRLALVTSLDELAEALSLLDADVPWPGDDAEGPRGRTAATKRVALPEGWLATRELTGAAAQAVADAEASVSGG